MLTGSGSSGNKMERLLVEAVMMKNLSNVIAGATAVEATGCALIMT